MNLCVTYMKSLVSHSDKLNGKAFSESSGRPDGSVNMTESHQARKGNSYRTDAQDCCC